MFHESISEAWQLRFGSEPPCDLSSLAPFLTHRSVRDYSEKPISEETLAVLIGAAQSAATSSNLQLWSVISVQEPSTREALTKIGADHKHIKEAPQFLVFLADHYRLKQAAKGSSTDGLDYAEFAIMAFIDASLAAERLVCAAESIGIGICYIGGLRNDPKGVQELLELPEGVFAVFGLCLGYPADDCKAEIKPRLAPSAVWYKEKYDLDVKCDEYDERMESFYVSQGMKGSVTWSMRSARRVDGSHLTGREVLKDYLESRGFYKR